MRPSDFLYPDEIRLYSASKTLVLVSGGPDSVLLFHFFLSLKKEFQTEFQVLHFNHHLRGEESDAEEKFVKALCATHGISCHVEHLRFESNTGIPELARKLRYRRAVAICKEIGFQTMATAHHADDVLETLVMRARRGTGVRGLAGIRPVSVIRSKCPLPLRGGRDAVGRVGVFTLARPLLRIYKKDILSELKKLGQDFCTDSSNLTTKYDRNKVRHEVLSSWSGEKKSRVLQASQVLQRVDDYFEKRLASKLKRHGFQMTQEDWQGMPEELRFRYFASMMRRCGFHQQAERHHFEKTKSVRAKLKLGDAVFESDESCVSFQSSRPSTLDSLAGDLKSPGAYYFGSKQFVLNISKATQPDWQKGRALQSGSKLLHAQIPESAWPLRITFPEMTQKILPFGKSHPISFKEFFQSHKISPLMRKSWPVLSDAQGEFLAVPGLEIAEKCKVCVDTIQPIYRLRFAGLFQK